MEDGDALELPGMRVQVLETPGHTIESISLLVFDLKKHRDKPYAVLTGDTLFIGDVGRPDLRASLGWTAQELGGYLYDSLHSKLMQLPDEVLVYPTHGAGSLCGRNLSKQTVSMMGEQKKFNYALQRMPKEEFIRLVTADQPDAPAYFTYDAILNTRERATLADALEQHLRPLSLEEVLQMREWGVQVLDVRDAAEYATGHLAGALNIGLGGQYATWAGTVLDASWPLVIIAEPGREQEAAMRLGRIGFDEVKGYLKDGMAALAGRPDLLETTERVNAAMLSEELAGEVPPVLLDVRGPGEWKSKHVSGSVNLPLTQLRGRIADMPRDRRIAVMCAGGYRSSIAVGLLKTSGINDVEELAGGITAWETAGQPIVAE
jgi:rhodanese-related sulfurtransferase